MDIGELVSTARELTPYIPYAIGGALAGLATVPFLEWGIHKEVMHKPTAKRSFWNKRQSFVHQDEHHLYYNPNFSPAKAKAIAEGKGADEIGEEIDLSTDGRWFTYYQNAANEDKNSAFTPREIMKVFAIPMTLGPAAVAAYQGIRAAFTGHFDADAPNSGVFISAAAAVVMGYYELYETAHAEMHRIGKKRGDTSYTFAHQVQPVPDGKLRFTKHTTDCLVNNIETLVERNIDLAPEQQKIEPDTTVVHNLEHQLAHNRKDHGQTMTDISAYDLIVNTVRARIAEEKEYRATLGTFASMKYKLGRWWNRKVRNSWMFKNADDRHFMHHVTDEKAETNPESIKNFNVLIPIPDRLLGTYIDSSAKNLDDIRKRKCLICPYTPVPFGKTPPEHPSAHQQAVVLTPQSS